MSFPPASPCHRPHHSLLRAFLPLIPSLLLEIQTTGHQRNEAPKVKTSPKAQALQGQAGLMGEAQAKVSRPQLSRPDTAGLHHLSMTQHILGFLAVLRHPSDTPQGVQPVLTPMSHKVRKENSCTIQEARDPNFRITRVIILGTSKTACNRRSALSIHWKIQEHSLLSPKIWV